MENHQMTQEQPMIKFFIDVASVGTVLGSLVALLPPLAALFTLIWTGIRIYETETIQKLFKKKK